MQLQKARELSPWHGISTGFGWGIKHQVCCLSRNGHLTMDDSPKRHFTWLPTAHTKQAAP